MKSITCPTCQVVTQVPLEATAYKCTNCGSLVENINRSPRVRGSERGSPVVKGIVIGLLGVLLALLLLGGSCNISVT